MECSLVHSLHTHDPEWTMIFAQHQSPVCLACIIEDLEDVQTQTNVQKDFHLSLMKSILNECQEVDGLFHQHPRVCQHLIDIITEHYAESRFLTSSAEICVQILDNLQSETMYIYFLDKFACQLSEQEESLPFFVAVLEKLVLISPIYILILVQVHEPLIKMLIEKWMTVSHFDEAAQCSMTLMLTQVFEQEILPAVPSYILFFVNKYLLNCLSSAQSLELQVRALALLKKVLQCGSGPAEDSEEFELLSLALKKQLLSRRETLSIAVAQCLNIIASSPCYTACLHHVLKSDLPEFLFESLHTMNIAQLDAVISCLQSFAQNDAFFSRCHAVYGMESLLQMVSTTLETKNNNMLHKAFTLLALIMERQSAGVPLFVNMTTQQFAQFLFVKGVQSYYLPVVCAVVRCATTQFSDENLCISLTTASVESVIGGACSKLEEALMEERKHDFFRNLGVSLDEILGRVLAFLCAVIKTVGNTRKKAPISHDTDLLLLIMDKCINVILPICASHLEQCDEGVMHGLLCFIKTLYTCVTSEGQLIHLAESVLTSSLPLNILVTRAQWRGNNDLDDLSTDVLVRTFAILMNSGCPQVQTLPICLHHGLEQLVRENFLHSVYPDSSVHLNVNKKFQVIPYDSEEEETGLALMMVLYYACLMDTQLPPSVQILSVVTDVYTRHPGMMRLHQVASKFILFLIAWLRINVDDDIQKMQTFFATLENMEHEIIKYILELSVETWATFHPAVFLWSFTYRQRAEGPGTKILEHWLLHTQEKNKEDTFSCEGSQVLFTLFHSEHFRVVLLSLIMSSYKDTDVLAKQFLLHALMKISDSSSETKELLSHIYSEVVSCFKGLFMESLHPDCQKVRSLLQVLTAVMQITSSATVAGRLNIKLFYHVVAYTGDRDAADTVILKECFACLLGMAKAAAADQALAAVPVMVQNTGFLQQLQLSLTSQINSFSALALSLLAWIVSNCPPYLSCSPISVSVAFLTKWLAYPGLEGPLSALQILCKVLEVHTNGHLCPVLQVKCTDSLLEEEQLFTSHEIRLLFCLTLQYVCWGDEQTRQCSMKTLGKLIDVCHIIGKEIGEHLVHHPWKPQLMHALLNSSGLGLSEHALQLISQIWCEDDFADRKLTSQLFESLKATKVNKENKELVATVLEKLQCGCKDKRQLQELQLKVLMCNSSKNFNTVAAE